MSYNYNRTIRNTGYTMDKALKSRTISKSTNAWDSAKDAVDITATTDYEQALLEANFWSDADYESQEQAFWAN